MTNVSDAFEMAGGTADGVADDTSALTAAIATGRAVCLGGQGRIYRITSTLTLQANQHLFGFGATIKTAANIPCLKFANGSNRNSSVSGITFEGSGKDSGSTLQDGILIDGGAGRDQVARVNISGCLFKNMGGAGVKVMRVVDTHQGNRINACHFQACNIGINVDERAEYTNITGNNIDGCNIGVRVQGGNTIGSGNHISDSVQTGFLLVSGDNDSRGSWANGTINHSTAEAIRCESTTKEDFIFSNIDIYVAGSVMLYRAKGVRFYGGTWHTITNYYEQGATNCTLKDVRLFTRPTNMNYSHSGEASDVLFKDVIAPNGSITSFYSRTTSGRL